MRVAIVGSRDYPDLARVAAYVRKIAAKYPDAVIVSGGARGVDSAAECTARGAKLDVWSYRPVELPGGGFGVKLVTPVTPGNPFIASEILPGMDFTTYGQAAYGRNRLIVQDADVVVAFQANGSRGTQHSIDIAREMGKPVFTP